jgi:import inner membrane translocase subunit TIM21
VAKYLHGPLTFHNNPPSATRPRHRNRHVTSQVFIDSAGNEHMRLNFYVRGCPPGSSSASSESSYLASLAEWSRDKVSLLSELTLDESIAWVKNCAEDMKERSKRLFRYLSGRPLSQPPLRTSPPTGSIDMPKKTEESAWSFAGLFSSLRGAREQQRISVREADGQIWMEGEVHADLVLVRLVALLSCVRSSWLMDIE